MSREHPCEVSVVVCTWNRASLLRGALEALVAQDYAPRHEIIVIDNASTDATRDVTLECAARHPQVRYLYEPRQGLSFARNAGVTAARGRFVAFTDDDIRVSRSWLRTIVAAFDSDPELACVGGPVLPEWPSPLPSWLTERHWAPLGIQDYGPQPLRVDAKRPICLIGANLVISRRALDRIGGFAPEVQRVCNGWGSTEDHEWHLRLWRAGMYARYEPALRTVGVITPERLEKRHHRAWHFGHGRHIARMRVPDFEAARLRLFGLPGHLLRQAFRDTARCFAQALRGDPGTAFDLEARLWFTAGFVRERWG